ncbi:MAG TPA: hypothetical protein VGS58_21510 [Candidatus Sulfopaludibacter sp.]|nr:hypothetical protein [Candidatus Sulfopaludibacter sp.]
MKAGETAAGCGAAAAEGVADVIAARPNPAPGPAARPARGVAAIGGRTLAEKALEVALGFAAAGLVANGQDRNPEVDKIEALFGLMGEPFCAMGAVFCFAKAYAFLAGEAVDEPTLKVIIGGKLTRYFRPSPSCGAIMTGARKMGIWRPAGDEPADAIAEMRPGDLVLYCWNGSGLPEHVGLFRADAGGSVRTVEFNTSPGQGGSQVNGHGVFVRTRPARFVVGSVAVG